jgi:hypothetical protein
MKMLITALALVTLIAVPVLAQSAAAAPKARRDSGQSRQHHSDTPSECGVEPGWQLIKCDQPPGEGF